MGKPSYIDTGQATAYAGQIAIVDPYRVPILLEAYAATGVVDMWGAANDVFPEYQIWECPCGSTNWNLHADGHIECAECDHPLWAVWGWSDEDPEA